VSPAKQQEGGFHDASHHAGLQNMRAVFKHGKWEVSFQNGSFERKNMVPFPAPHLITGG
jgi:hypothetical protein